MLNLRLIKFLLVGMLNTLVGYGLFCFFVFTGLHYSFAVLIATILGVLFNFQSTRKLVFNDRHGCGLRTLSLFILSYGIVYLVNILVVKSFLSLGLNSYQAGFIALLPVAFLSYFLQSRLVFIKPKSCRRATSDSPPFNHTT